MIQHKVNQSTKIKLLRALTLIGCFSTGIIYGSVGVIALLSFLKLKKGGADESSFFVLLNDISFGRILNGVIIIGAIAFIVWRFYEAFADPYKLGKNTKAILLRIGAAFSSGADAFIAFSVLQALFSPKKALITGEPVREREMVGNLLEADGGKLVLIVFAGIVILTALVLVFYGLSKRFTENINAKRFSKTRKHIIHGLAYAGYLSRGIILGVIGFFLFKAAVSGETSEVVNTDKAFDFIGDHIGAIVYWLVAIGTICYGLYMFILGMNYDIKGGKNE